MWQVLSLGRVLLLGSRFQTIIGRPYVPGASVLAAVEEHFRDGKVHVFKKHKRKRYSRYQGPRPNLTTLRILSIKGIEVSAASAARRTAAAQQALPIRWYGQAKRASLLDGGVDDNDDKEDEESEAAAAVRDAAAV